MSDTKDTKAADTKAEDKGFKPETKAPTAAEKAAQAKREQAEVSAKKQVAAEQAARAEGRTVMLNSQPIKIRRDESATISTSCYDYELPIYYAIYGQQAVIPVGASEQVEVADWNADTEMLRLRAKFNTFQKQGDDVVERVYGNVPQRLAKAAGVKYDPAKAGANGPAESVQTDNRRKNRVRGA